jgi:hypothetical protein
MPNLQQRRPTPIQPSPHATGTHNDGIYIYNVSGGPKTGAACTGQKQEQLQGSAHKTTPQMGLFLTARN